MTKIGYKKCISREIKYRNERCIVGVFEIPDDTKISPNFDNTFAKYKVNKCKLIRIEHVNGEIIEDLNSLIPTIFFDKEPHHEYKLNETYEIDDMFNTNYDIKDYGIVMFFERSRAEMYLLEYIENGLLIRWRDTGIKYSEENYKNLKRNGICKYYHPNGVLKKECLYLNDNRNAIETIYNEEGYVIKTEDFTPKKYPDTIYKT